MMDARRFFTDRYGAEPSLVLRAPGRINLIGDHTDYCGLPVLPMAIAQGIEVAGRVSVGPGVHAVSTLDATTADSNAPGERKSWAKYVLAVHDQLLGAVADGSGSRQLGAELAIDGDLPATGGLSSSSALAIGCITALDRLWRLDLGPDRLIELALDAERQAAVAGGAMDQTVITYARPGHALRIDFDPPARRHIPMPDDARWVAAYSGTSAPKGASAADAYNSFVLASRAATALLAERLGRPHQPGQQLSSVTDAHAEAVDSLPTVSVAEAAARTGGDDLGLPGDRPLDLAVSARHVLSEAGRVSDAEAALMAGDLGGLGRLMDESHASLRRYGSSTSNLDRLVAAARTSGAAGARVTGAGFGGWAVALCGPDVVDAVVAATIEACGGPAFEVTAEGGVLSSLDDASLR